MIWSGDYDRQVQSLLPLIKEKGFDGIEIPLFRLEGFNAAAVRRDTEALGLECTVASAFLQGLSPISEDASIRARAIQHLKDLIQAVAEAGAGILCGPMYSPVGYLPGRRRTAHEWKYAVDGLQQLGDTLAANRVTLAVEPPQPLRNLLPEHCCRCSPALRSGQPPQRRHPLRHLSRQH